MLEKNRMLLKSGKKEREKRAGKKSGKISNTTNHNIMTKIEDAYCKKI